MSRPKSTCTFIGPLWVFFTGKLPFFESCCKAHDDDYGEECEEYRMADEEGWGREYADMKFKQCIEAKATRETWWDELCWWAVRHFGWLFWKCKR